MTFSPDNAVYLDRGDKLQDIVIQRVNKNQPSRVAKHVLSILGIAYEREFEVYQSLLPSESAKAYFDKDSEERVKRQEASIEAAQAKGSTLWMAYFGRYLSSSSFDDPVGFIKTSPSRSGYRKFGSPNCYVNDIAVTLPGQGLGSALLYTALEKDFKPGRLVATDVLPGSEGFFRTAGLKPNKVQPEQFTPLVIGGVALHERETRYETNIGNALASLERRQPWLTQTHN